MHTNLVSVHNSRFNEDTDRVFLSNLYNEDRIILSNPFFGGLGLIVQRVSQKEGFIVFPIFNPCRVDWRS